MSVVAVKNLSFRYKGSDAAVLRDVNLSVGAGECVAIAGRNGAGKSTLAGVLAGLAPAFFEGELGGTQLNGELRPVCVTQNVDSQVLNDSVREELSFFLKYSETPRFAGPEAALAGSGLEPLLDKKTYQLSSGEKQNFVLGCALACASGNVLILDEPSSFLDEANAALLAGRLRNLKEEGAALVIFGHELSSLSKLVDRWLLLENGELKPVSAPAGEVVAALRPGAASGRQPLLAGSGLGGILNGKAVFSDFSFELNSGEILGVCGRNGSGKTTLARILAGLEQHHAGRLLWQGEPVEFGVLRKKVRLILNNPYHSLFYRTVNENLVAASGGKAPAAELLDALGLAEAGNKEITQLSWGQAQKAQFLCGILAGAEILILDESFSAVDREGIAACAGLLQRHCAAGGAAIFISHSGALVRSLCSAVREMEGATCAAH